MKIPRPKRKQHRLFAATSQILERCNQTYFFTEGLTGLETCSCPLRRSMSAPEAVVDDDHAPLDLSAAFGVMSTRAEAANVESRGRLYPEKSLWIPGLNSQAHDGRKI